MKLENAETHETSKKLDKMKSSALDLTSVEWVLNVNDDIVKQLRSIGFARVRLIDPESSHSKLLTNAKEWFACAKKDDTETEPGFGGMRSVGYCLQSYREEFEVRLKYNENKVGPSSGNELFDQALIEAYRTYSRSFQGIVKRLAIDLKVDNLTDIVQLPDDATCSLHSIRMCNYLKCGESTVCPTHTDVGFLTLIPYASVPGLECQNLNGDWIKVEENRDNKSDAVLIVGDTMEYMTGIPATPHRVVHENGTRMSVSFHTYARPDAKLESKFRSSIFVRDLYDRKRTKNRTIKSVSNIFDKKNEQDISKMLKKFLVL